MMTVVIVTIAAMIVTIISEKEEGDKMSCCCVKDLRIQGGVLQMLRCNKWEDVGGGSFSAAPPPVDTEIVPEGNAPPSGYRCTKADSITKMLSGLGLKAFEVYDANPTATPAEQAELLSFETGLNLSLQYATQVMQMIDTEASVLADFDSGVITTVKSSLFNVLDNSLDMADISLDTLGTAIVGSGATSSQQASWTAALNTVALDTIKNRVAGAIQSGDGDCSDVQNELFPPVGALLSIGFEDSETDFFWTDTERLTDLKHAGAKSAGYFANAPATSAGCIYRVYGWTGEVGQIKMWCYREDHDASDPANIIIKVEGKLEGGSYITLADYYTLEASNSWVQLTRGFTRDAWVDLQITVSVGSTHAIGIRVDDVEVS